MSLSIRWSTVYAQQDLPFMRSTFKITKLEAKVKSSTVYARITRFIPLHLWLTFSDDMAPTFTQNQTTSLII